MSFFIIIDVEPIFTYVFLLIDFQIFLICVDLFIFTTPLSFSPSESDEKREHSLNLGIQQSDLSSGASTERINPYFLLSFDGEHRHSVYIMHRQIFVEEHGRMTYIEAADNLRQAGADLLGVLMHAKFCLEK